MVIFSCETNRPSWRLIKHVNVISVDLARWGMNVIFVSIKQTCGLLTALIKLTEKPKLYVNFRTIFLV